jgi:hypothetical protein
LPEFLRGKFRRNNLPLRATDSQSSLVNQTNFRLITCRKAAVGFHLLASQQKMKKNNHSANSAARAKLAVKLKLR